MKNYLIMIFLFSWIGVAWGQKKATLERLQLFKDKSSNKIEPTLFWAQYDATRRGSMLYVDENQRVRVLAENPPDAAIESILAITANVKGLKGDVGEAEAAFNSQKSIADLAKRTAAVNMLRDALYRLNELYYATADEKKDILETLRGFENKDITKQVNGKTVDISSLPVFQQSLTSSDIKYLFEKVICSTKEIAVEEAKVDLEIEKTKQEQSKEGAIRLNNLNLVLQKVEGTMSKDEMVKFIKEIEKEIK